MPFALRAGPPAGVGYDGVVPGQGQFDGGGGGGGYGEGPPPPGGRVPGPGPLPPRLLLTGEVVENERNANNFGPPGGAQPPPRFNNLPPVPVQQAGGGGGRGGEGVPRFQGAQPGGIGGGGPGGGGPGGVGGGGAGVNLQQRLAPVRPPGTPPDRDVAIITPPGGGGGGGRGGPPLRPISEIREIREMEERLIVAESAAAAQPELVSRLRQLERRVALAEVGGEKKRKTPVHACIHSLKSQRHPCHPSFTTPL